MAKQKISNLAKELNVGLPNIFEFLRKNNIDVPETPNTRVEDSVAEMLIQHFQPDREIKTRSDQQSADRMQSRAAAREKSADTPRPAAPEQAFTPSDMAQKPRILGKIDLNAKGSPVVVKTTEAKPQPAQQKVEKAPAAPASAEPKAEPAKAAAPEAPAPAPAAAAPVAAPTPSP
ncbi:MAG: translation initiation factor IF-2 N-terminal domain-containing protein, partial [Muribaculaceae bacterium]|nr:translation initiation factor IF-2 N-terminal domain-containing protein [Muribaculaceae bacterium]